MKVKAAPRTKINTCPDCGSSAMVMGMKSYNIHTKGCLTCSNGQGIHLSAKAANAAWKIYVLNENNVHSQSSGEKS